MIVRITGKVKFPITLDPTVWIFDDRKVLLENAFTTKKEDSYSEVEWEKTSRAWDREIYQQKVKPPVNKSISKMEGKKILEGTYVMPIKDFLATSEPDQQATTALLHKENGESTSISLEELEESVLLFAKEGKPIKDEGPVHLYLKVDSKKEQPIKGISRIEVR